MPLPHEAKYNDADPFVIKFNHISNRKPCVMLKIYMFLFSDYGLLGKWLRRKYLVFGFSINSSMLWFEKL